MHSITVNTCCQNIRKQYLPHGGKYLTLKYKYKYKYSGQKYEYEYKYFETVLEYKYKYQVLHLCLI